jgi:fumarylpyruvate hydrolase
MAYEFDLRPPPAIPIAGSKRLFPVRRIYAIGRNYADHAAETGLGGNGGSVPGISLKPPDSIITNGASLPYPPATVQLEPEIEMVAAIGKAGADIPVEAALEHVFGYAVGFDMIRRDVLRECIANEHSWDLCKSFAGASPVGDIAPADKIGHPVSGEISIEVNGVVRQKGDLSQLIWSTAEIVSRLSRYSPVEPGDIVFTGTPKGPSPVVRGDDLVGRIAGIGTLSIGVR